MIKIIRHFKSATNLTGVFSKNGVDSSTVPVGWKGTVVCGQSCQTCPNPTVRNYSNPTRTDVPL